MKLTHIDIAEQLWPVLSFPGKPRVLLDQTIAKIYKTETKYVVRAVKRNPDRFPDDFVFQLTNEEFAQVKQLPCFTNLKHTYRPPYAFTHLGSNMVANVIKSEIAIQRSLQIVRVFTSIETGEFQEQLQHIYQMICILTQEIDTDRNKRKKLEQKIELLDQQLKQLFPNSPKNILPKTISSKQAQQLKDLVDQKGKNRKRKMEIWSLLKRKFNVSRYIHLQTSDFEDAKLWLQNFKGKP